MASRTSFPSIIPIDISVIEIPRSVVRLTRLSISDVGEVGDDALLAADDRAAHHVAVRLSEAYEMSIPWAYVLPSESIVQFRIVTAVRRTWMPSSSNPER